MMARWLPLTVYKYTLKVMAKKVFERFFQNGRHGPFPNIVTG